MEEYLLSENVYIESDPASIISFFNKIFRTMTGGKLIRPAPAEIEFKNMRFLITEQPHDSTIQNYITILKEHKVTHLVCATDPTYKTDDLAQSGVTFTELSFLDGSPPSQDIIDKLSLIHI